MFLRKAELDVAIARTTGDDVAVIKASVDRVSAWDTRVHQLALKEWVGGLFEEQDLDGRLSQGDVKYTAAIKRAMGIVDEEAEFAGVELPRHNNAASFEWAADKREDGQYEKYARHLSDSVPIDGGVFTYVPTGTRFKGALTTKVKGTSRVHGNNGRLCMPPAGLTRGRC